MRPLSCSGGMTQTPAAERVSGLAACARCRGFLFAAAGKIEDALAAYRRALALYGEVEIPLDRGRTLLALGALLRREAPPRGPRNAGRGARRLRAGGRGALGRAGACRARPDQRPGAVPGRAHARRGTCRRARRRGEDEPGGRSSALPVRADSRGAPLTRVREARRAAPHRAVACPGGVPNTGDSAVKHRGVARFGRAARSVASRHAAAEAESEEEERCSPRSVSLP